MASGFSTVHEANLSVGSADGGVLPSPALAPVHRGMDKLGEIMEDLKSADVNKSKAAAANLGILAQTPANHDAIRKALYEFANGQVYNKAIAALGRLLQHAGNVEFAMIVVDTLVKWMNQERYRPEVMPRVLEEITDIIGNLNSSLPSSILVPAYMHLLAMKDAPVELKIAAAEVLQNITKHLPAGDLFDLLNGVVPEREVRQDMRRIRAYMSTLENLQNSGNAELRTLATAIINNLRASVDFRTFAGAHVLGAHLQRPGAAPATGGASLAGKSSRCCIVM